MLNSNYHLISLPTGSLNCGYFHSANVMQVCFDCCISGSCTVRWENRTMYCVVSAFAVAVALWWQGHIGRDIPPNTVRSKALLEMTSRSIKANTLVVVFFVCFFRQKRLCVVFVWAKLVIQWLEPSIKKYFANMVQFLSQKHFHQIKLCSVFFYHVCNKNLKDFDILSNSILTYVYANDLMTCKKKLTSKYLQQYLTFLSVSAVLYL